MASDNSSDNPQIQPSLTWDYVKALMGNQAVGPEWMDSMLGDAVKETLPYGKTPLKAGSHEDNPMQKLFGKAQGAVKPGSATDELFGIHGNRYQFWPERMIRSGVTAAGDAARGEFAPPGLRREDFTDKPKPQGEIAWQPNDPILERSMDMSGLMGTGMVAAMPGSVGTFGGRLKSAVTKAIEESSNKAAAPDQWLSYLKGRPGVKMEELEWMKLPEYLNQFKAGEVSAPPKQPDLFIPQAPKGAPGKQQLSKEDLLKYAKENEVQVEDVILKRDQNERTTRHHDQIAPGETSNYRELLMRYNPKGDGPSKPPPFNPDLVQLDRVMNNPRQADVQIYYDGNYIGKFKDDPSPMFTGPGRRQTDDYWMAKAKEIYEKGDPHSPFNPDLNEQFRRAAAIYDEGQETQPGIYGGVRGSIQRGLGEDGRRKPEWNHSHWRDHSNIMGWSRTNERHLPVAAMSDDAAKAVAEKFGQNDPLKITEDQWGTLPEAEKKAFLSWRHGKPMTVPGEYQQWELYQNGQRVSTGDMDTANRWQRVLLDNPGNPDVAQFEIKSTKIPNNTLHMIKHLDAERGTKTYFIDEIQSDWHQQGRDRGYKDSIGGMKSASPEEKRLMELRELDKEGSEYRDKTFSWKDIQELSELEKKYGPSLTAKARREYGTSGYAGDRNQVPDAPFKTTWHELALKRALIDAVERGYDQVAWTSGTMQARRWSSYPQEERGQGMIKFYDDMLSSYANKLGKQYGTKVEQGKLPVKAGWESQGPPTEAGREPLASNHINIMKITPELADAVRKGLPLFQRGLPLPPSMGQPNQEQQQ